MPFEKGKSGNPKGRPKLGLSLAERIRARAEGNWDGIIDKAIMLANKGDKSARDWLSNYGYGKPIETVRSENVNHDELVIINDD